MNGLTYDAGALVAAERGDRRVWRRHNELLERGQRAVVPAGALAQAWRGGPQALLSRLLAGCRIDVLDEDAARATGWACARSATTDVIDASVVVGALRRGDACVTSDPDDLVAVADALGRRLRVFSV